MGKPKAKVSDGKGSDAKGSPGMDSNPLGFLLAPNVSWTAEVRRVS